MQRVMSLLGRALPSAAAAASLLVAACRDAPTRPTSAADDAAGLSASGQRGPTAGQQPDDERLRDYYIVRFRDDVANVRAQARQLEQAHAGQVEYVYERALRGFSIRLPAAAAAALARDARVVSVRPVKAMRLEGVQSAPPWGLDRIDQRALPLDGSYTYGGSGANYTAYIFDTGIRTSHMDFGGRAAAGFNVADGRGAIDCQGHGTHVAGTVGGATYGVAKQVQLVSVRVFGYSNCGGTDADLLAGIDWVLANVKLPAVANMSLGFGEVVAEVEAAIESLIASGVAVVVAAGNSDVDACSQTPSRIPAAVTVAASDRNDQRSWWWFFSASNWGRCVDLFAPGTDVLSAGIASNTDSETMSGTSMAAPHVAGAVAYTQEPVAADAVSRVLANATPNKIGNAGSGTPNLLLNTELTPVCDETSCGSPPPPDPRFDGVQIAGPLGGVEGTAVLFSLTGPPDPALTYEWDFGDGATATGPSAAHAYIDNDAYLVRLTAQDVSDPTVGVTRLATVTITNAAPVVEAGPDSAVLAGTAFTLRSSFSDAGVKDALWARFVSWGDGKTSSTATITRPGALPAVSHTYATPGTYTVNVSVMDKDGASGADQLAVTVLPNDPPAASANGPYAGNEGVQIQFSSEGSSDPNGQSLTYSWRFGDGTTSTAASPKKAYADNGEYTVTLVVKDASGATDTATTMATIANVAPTATWTAPASVAEGSAYTLSLAGTDAGTADRSTLEYSFDCGQGAEWTAWSTTVKSVTCPAQPDQGASFTAQGRVRDKDGELTAYSKQVSIVNAPPVPTLAAVGATSIEPGSVINVEGSFTDAGAADGPWSYAIAWGDGSAAATGTASEQGAAIAGSHSYAMPGTYYVILSVTDKDGGKGASAKVTVKVDNDGPVANPNGPYTGSEGAYIQFSSAGSSDPDGQALAYYWAFGDGTSSTAANPKKAYADNATYTVGLVVRDASGAKDTTFTTATVTNVAPTATLSASGAFEGTDYTLSMSGTDAGSKDRSSLEYQFDCGQGAGWTAWSTTKTVSCPALPDQQTVAVRGQVRDKDGGVTEYTRSVSIANAAPVVILAATSATTIEPGGSVGIQGSFTDAGGADAPWAYTIAWGDGTTSLAAPASPGTPITGSHSYAMPGTYTVTLSVSDKDAGTGTAKLAVSVANTPPVANPNGPYSGNEGAYIQFSSAGSTDPDGGSLAYYWAFGDGTSSTAANPKKAYADNGTYNVGLVVRDASGAKDTTFTTVTVANVPPTATLGAPTSLSEGSSYTLSMSGTDAGSADRSTLQYAFDCGQGGGWGAWSTTKSATCPALPDQQSVVVQGQVKDKDGGVSVAYSRTVTVTNAAPVVTLAATSPTSLAAGGSMSISWGFTDKGETDAPWTYTIFWGDGTTSTGSMSSQSTAIPDGHPYGSAGTFIAYVTVRDKDGAAGSSATITVTVSP